jgi:hypothetical protein
VPLFFYVLFLRVMISDHNDVVISFNWKIKTATDLKCRTEAYCCFFKISIFLNNIIPVPLLKLPILFRGNNWFLSVVLNKLQFQIGTLNTKIFCICKYTLALRINTILEEKRGLPDLQQVCLRRLMEWQLAT